MTTKTTADQIRRSIRNQDPHHEDRQAARLYGHLISRGEVQRVTQIITALGDCRPIQHGINGVMVKKWHKKGHADATRQAISAVLAPYYEAGGPFEDIGERYSRTGAEWYCRNRLYNLNQAIQKGIWTEDGVAEWDPEA